MNRISIITLPVLVVGALALGGCTRSDVVTNPPGGTYLSTSAGASFEQSVAGHGEGKDIASLDLGKIHRSLRDPNTIFMAAGEDGMVISKNDGATWSVISTSLAGTVDVALLNSGVLVATGVDADGQGVVVRSLDEGKSWQNVFTLPLAQQPKRLQILGSSQAINPVITAMEVDPSDGDSLWAGTNEGTIFVATQAAKVWQKNTELNSSTVLVTGNRAGVGVVSLEVPSRRSGEVVVVTRDKRLFWIKGGTATAIVVPESSSSLAFGGVTGNRNVIDVALVPGFPDALIIGTDTGAVVTRDGGKTFLEMQLPLDASKRIGGMAVAISPTNVNRFVIAIGGIVYRSEDAGASWQTTGVGPVGFAVTDISINPKNAARVLAVLKATQS